MPCGQQLIYQVDGDRARAFMVRCNSWDCSFCAPLRRARLRRLAHAGNPNMFMTLTTSPHVELDAYERARRMTRSWHKLVAQIKRKLRTNALDYLAVVEQTKRGEPHMHILLRSKYIDHAWLSAAWERMTGAKIVHVRRIDDTGRAAAYVTKYLSKTPMRFGRNKRYFRSRRYAPKHVKTEAQARWKVLPRTKLTMSLAALQRLMRECGWQLTSASMTGCEWTQPPGCGPPALTPPLS